MKRTIKSMILVLAILIMILVAGCSGGINKDIYDEGDVIAKAKTAITYFNNQEYSSLVAMMDDASVSEDVFSAAYDMYLPDAGAFVEYGKELTIGTHENGVDFGCAVIVAIYENAEYTYTISFNPDMVMTGFYFK